MQQLDMLLNAMTSFFTSYPTVTTAVQHIDYDMDPSAELHAFFINESLFMEINGSSFINDTSSYYNGSFNDTLDGLNVTDQANTEEVLLLIRMIAMALVLGLMILVTIIGNVFVIAAIILERNLQNVANYLVVSLAVADLFVACLVMPLGAVYEISSGWILGAELCDIWTSCDVLCCTASILHLVAIAADRYWTVTNIDYNNLRTPRRVFFMIFCVWFAALIVSLAPQFGWKDPEYMKRIEEQTCMVSQDVAYQIFATCCTFYVPLLVILFLYWKIYKIARKRIQRRTQKTFTVTVNETECESTTPKPQQQQREHSVERQKRKRLKICFGSATAAAAAGSIAGASAEVASKVATLGDKKHTLGINIETVTADFASLAITREETEFSTSNYDNKSHAGTEVTTVSSDADDFRTSNASEILTLSHQVASAAHQQQMIATHLNAITPYKAHSSGSGSGGGGGGSGSGGGSGGVGKSAGASAGSGTLASIANPHQKLAKRRQLLEAKRERKAAQTLAIITGAFVVCWLPFFVMALLLSLCKNCYIHPAVASLFLWLGYFNSTLNPIIYTVFNPEFRRAFQRILYGRKYAARCRSAKI